MNITSPPRHISRLARGIALFVACATVFPGSAWANPVGAQIINGQVSMVTSGNQLVVTNTPGAVINWQSFSVGAGELTRFVQQDLNSSVLNRITGQDPSQILGSLQSNGKVFLINPNGIIFGAGARVDVNGLVASSLKLSNEDFAAGRNNFTGDGSSSAVHNMGAITTPSGGQVYLIAPNVTNSGLINSPNGDVLLAAGHSVQIADTSDPSMRVVVSAANDQVLNVGNIVAQGGKIGIYAALVRQRGLVTATSAVWGENGKIVFKASDTATLETGSMTSTSGGEIAISAETVSVADGTVNLGNGVLTVTRTKIRATEFPDVPPAPTPPTLDQCIANPLLALCNSVLPGLASCISESFLPGCSAVLPSLTICIASPSTTGCSAVLPTLSTCIAGPTTTGCSAILPTISNCIVNPVAPGCVAVLPSVKTCVVNPSAMGCNVVLPSLTSCISTPSAVGCNVVLPTLTSCISTPSAPGCSVVLPSLSVCTATPAMAGCSAVLPSLNICTSTPSAPGCSAVLPSLSSCTATPTRGGCSVVLPTLAQCSASPTLSGCASVLPPVNICLSNPNQAGCAVVVPPATNANAPAGQAINTTVNLINTVVPNQAAPPPVGIGTPPGATGGTRGAVATADTPGKKAEDKNDDTKDVVVAEKTGVKKNEAPKKTYCN